MHPPLRARLGGDANGSAYGLTATQLHTPTTPAVCYSHFEAALFPFEAECRLSADASLASTQNPTPGTAGGTVDLG